MCFHYLRLLISISLWQNGNSLDGAPVLGFPPCIRGSAMKKALASLAAMAALCATPVLAADMPLKAPPPAPIYTWTGFYIGGFGGWGWSDQNWTFPDGDPLGSGNRNGPLGGFQAGYDYQLSPTGLIGVQADVSFGNITGNAGRPSPDGRCWSGGDQTADCAASAKPGQRHRANWHSSEREYSVYFKTGAAWVGQDLNVNNIIDITGGTCSPIGSHHANYNANQVNSWRAPSAWASRARVEELERFCRI